MPSTAGTSILCVVGARPNFMKIAPVIRAMKGASPPLPARLVHTGQHYDPEMNGQHFQALGIPDPGCALVAVKKGVAVIHVEAGLRSFDRAAERLVA